MPTRSPPADDGSIAPRADTSWRSPDLLRDLHVDRGWTAADIARVHDTDAAAVRDRLKELDVFQGGTHPPKSGLARKLWEHGLENGGEL